MLVPLSWVRDFVAVEASPSEIADALNQLGLEVEEVVDPSRGISNVVVARIVDVLPHPNADKLQLADVDFGHGSTRVVCGAENIYAGMLAPLARAGATLPAFEGEPLRKRKIRGQVSDGMLCSAAELGLGDDHSGIVDLRDAVVGDAVELGTDVVEAMGLRDTVFDLSITPNRPDAMSIAGVARELAAHFGLPFDPPTPVPSEAVDVLAGATVVIEAPQRCPRLSARIARVRPGASPSWMQRRLRLAGMRPISNIVDVTNYVMLEWGRPLHAFDLDRMEGRGILVRLARPDETLTTLDGVERTLTADDLVICDAAGIPRAIAGVMGGASAEVSDSTTEIILESAHFEPSGVAATSKRLGLRSEASARFERGADPASTLPGADRAMALLADVADADVVDGCIDVCPSPITMSTIVVRPGRVNAVLGTELSAGEMRALLEPLGIGVADGDPFTVTAPTWRPDLEREIDIVEEIGRRHGLQNIARTVPATPGRVGHLTLSQSERRLVVDTLVGAGFVECYTLSLVAPADLERAGAPVDDVVHVENPLRAEESVLRPAIFPGLIRAVAGNVSYGSRDVALFETGVVFRPPSPSTDRSARDRVLPREHTHLGAIRSGSIVRSPFEPDRDVDVYDALAVVEALRDALRIADLRVEAASVPGLHRTRSAQVLVDGAPVGVVGEVASEVRAGLDVDVPVVALELDLDALLAGARRPRAVREVSRYPASNIDLAFVVADSVPAGAVGATLRSAAGEVLESVRCFDVFRSDALGEGKVSLAFALRFRARDRTLTDEQVGGLRKKCIRAVEKAHGAELRA